MCLLLPLRTGNGLFLRRTSGCVKFTIFVEAHDTRGSWYQDLLQTSGIAYFYAGEIACYVILGIRFPRTDGFFDRIFRHVHQPNDNNTVVIVSQCSICLRRSIVCIHGTSKHHDVLQLTDIARSVVYFIAKECSRSPVPTAWLS